jgi:hypothetical protein
MHASELEAIHKVIIRDPRYQSGIAYGKPRKGHDEGTVENHIKELTDNLSALDDAGFLTSEEFFRLLLIIHIHDTFKLESHRLRGEEKNVSLRDPRSHPMLARKFFEEFTDDKAMLNIIEWHDEAHAIRRHFEEKQVIRTARLNEALHAIGSAIELYLIFVVVDSMTDSKLKDRHPRWFLDVVEDYLKPPFHYRAYEACRILDKAHAVKRHS